MYTLYISTSRKIGPQESRVDTDDLIPHPPPTYVEARLSSSNYEMGKYMSYDHIILSSRYEAVSVRIDKI